MKYYKKPIIIEAKQLTLENANEVYDWIINNGGVVTDVNDEPVSLTISTLEGEINVHEGDYIIKSMKGEFFSYKPDIFEQIYGWAPIDIL